MTEHKTDDLPGYIAINDDTLGADQKNVIRTSAAEVSFPLSSEDKRDLKILEAKYDQEKNMAGLAAPQIGIGKRMIIFAAPNNPDIRKVRVDHDQFMGKTIWINPTYTPRSDETFSDFEGCFSVQRLIGLVPRYKHITYTAQLPNGTSVQGEATGFLARVIQHEVGHLNAQLFIDLVPKEELMTIEEYVEIRNRRIAALETILAKKP